jgi:hypothetical protein
MTTPATAWRVVPIPQLVRRRYITRQAALMLRLSPAAADGHLGQQLRMQADAMRRRGIAKPVMERETDALEQAIRAAKWRLAFGLRGPGESA